MTDNDLNNEIKLLKERIKKKTERINKLNNNIKRLDADLKYAQKERREYICKYNAVKQLLPLKYYKVTYSVNPTPWNEESKKVYNELVMARHFHELLIDLKIQHGTNQVTIIDILEVAS